MANISTRLGSAIRQVGAAAYTLPTDYPEADGTLAWDSTTILVVQIDAGGQRGCGYSYAHASMASLVRDTLAPLLSGCHAMQVPHLWQDMVARIRNLGRPGLVSCALAEAYQIPLSSHTAPAPHLHAMCAIPQARHMEYFQDHVRIEQQLFDGVQVSGPGPAATGPVASRPRADPARERRGAPCGLRTARRAGTAGASAMCKGGDV